ncbi:hypothetical protein ZOSMA_83G00380 [Zostera marina]|uniref:Ubiquitin-like protease family profile domain-containing protein n=1 Tax=Zostera marina TaxID=29655 RepID=A0A0K9NNM3_ZOSMR|nr:hypothetical protein ZOSMA_83G00380 [Zostera marina]
MPGSRSNDPIDNDMFVDLLTPSPTKHVTLDLRTSTPGMHRTPNELHSLPPNVESTIILRSPVMIDGIDMNEETLTGALGKLQIFSGEIEQDVVVSPHFNEEVSTKEIADFLNSQCNEDAPARQVISPPSFDVLGDYRSEGIEQPEHTSAYNSPTKMMTSESENPATPYIYSRTNLIVMVEEGQSMFAKLRDDCRYQKITIRTQEGVTRGQLHLKNEYAYLVEQQNFMDRLNTTVNNGWKKKTNDEERLFVNQNNGETASNLNHNTKRLVMNPEYNYLFFFMINNDSVFCNGSDLQDIVRHRLYTPLLVKVFAGISRAELVEKSIHEAKFQFVNPDLFDDEGCNRSFEVVPEKLSYIDAEKIDGMITSSMEGNYKRFARYFIIPMRTVKHWHFLVWTRDDNTFTHFDSNRNPLHAIHLGAAKRAVIWMTRWFRQKLVTYLPNDPEFIESLKFPQETNAKMDGGLYMIKGITDIIEYLHIEDGILNNYSLETALQWTKNDVQKFRNYLFRRLTERMQFCPWHLKMQKRTKIGK